MMEPNSCRFRNGHAHLDSSALAQLAFMNLLRMPKYAILVPFRNLPDRKTSLCDTACIGEPSVISSLDKSRQQERRTLCMSRSCISPLS